MNKETQKTRIMQYITDFGSITRMESITELGCINLPARITELKKDGCPIKTDMITVKNRWGESTRIARYSFDKERAGEHVG